MLGEPATLLWSFAVSMPTMEYLQWLQYSAEPTLHSSRLECCMRTATKQGVWRFPLTCYNC